MSVSCNQCRNVVFEPALEGNLDSLQAKIHSDEASLKHCVDKRSCHLFVVLHGMLENRKRFGPIGRQSSGLVGQFPDISLWLHYEGHGDEGSDDWEFIEDESSKEDAPKDVVFTHPLGSDDLRIRDPRAIARSTWYTEEPSQQDIRDLESSHSPQSRDTSTSGTLTMAVASKWIENCRATHAKCRKRSTKIGHLPSRLLDVSEALDKFNGIVTLVDSAKLVGAPKIPVAVQYVTLSHRWNPSNNYFTTTSNVDEHQNTGMRITLLPKTFAEACVTVRVLGLRYIWIDSLCIIQDSKADKATEIPKLADYYQSAELNLSASTESLGGLWSDRDGTANKPFSINATLKLPEKNKQVVLELAPVLRAAKSHLDYRGWILQERIFPRRTLFFDAYWISFECSEMGASESCPRGVTLDASSNRVTVETAMGTNLGRDCTLSIIGGMVRSMDPTNPIRETGARRQAFTLWYRILNEYSLRQLSFESDRLNAISGLAERLSQILNDEYIGGIWKSNLLECLQWRPDDPLRGGETIRQTEYRAPTWSWASCELLPRSSFRDARRTLPLQISNDYVNGAESSAVCDILGVTWQYQSSNKWGNLSSASLALSGRPLRGFAYAGPDPDLGMDLDTLAEETEEAPMENPTRKSWAGWGSRTLTWLHISGRTKLGEQVRMITMVSPDTSDQRVEGYVYLLPLAERWSPGGGDSLFCLVLREVGPGRYERIGHSVTRSCYMIKVAARQIQLL